MKTVFFSSSLQGRLSRYGFLFSLPAIIFFGTFYIYPIFQTFYMSFMKWGLLTEPKYVGLKNYKYLLIDPEFSNSLIVTFYYVFGTVIPIWLLSLLLALVFNNSFKYRQGFLTIYYIPAFISLTVWSLIWMLMYHPTYGLISFFTGALGFEYVRFLQNPDLVMIAMILLSVWKGTPVYMIIFIAGLRSIPEDLYEAAKVDGSSKLQRFIYITLPMLRPVMLFVVVISIIEGFKVFTPMYIITKGGPGSATRVLSMFIFENGFTYLKMGYASAASVIFLLILVLFSLIQFKLLSRKEEI